MALFADEMEPEAATAPEAVSVESLPVRDAESAADIAVTSADATGDVSAADTALDMPGSHDDDMLAIDLDSMLALAEPTAAPKASDVVGDAAHDADVGSSR
jgi:hypothetical protein